MSLRALQGPAGGAAPVGGSGTSSPSTIPRWTGATTLGDSIITQNPGANAVGVGATVSTTWAAGWRALQVGQNAAIWAETTAIDGRFSQNVVWTGSAFNYLVNGSALMYAQNANGHTWSYAGAGTAGNPISFTTGMILNTSGNVGIGTTSPLARLHVNGSSASAVQAFIRNDNGGTSSAAELVFGTYSGAIPTGAGNPGPQAKISAINTHVATAQTDLAFYTYPSTGTGIVERMRISNAGTQAQSQVAIGTSTFTSGCSLTVAQSIDVSQSAQGVKLPATPGNTDPNTLDAYRDGGTAGSGGVSFTATLKGGTTDPTTPVTVTGQYILIGKMMIVTVYFANVTTTGASGNVYITTDIPAALRPATRGTAAVGLEVFTTGAGVGSFIDVRTDGTFYLLENFNNGGTAIGQHSAGTNRYLWFTATYIIP